MTRRETAGLVALAVVVAALTSLGIASRATYGAQTTADEPQYLLSALGLWEDFDLDISDELASRRYRDFHETDLPEQTMALEDGRRVSPHDPLLPLLLALPVGLGGWIGAKLALALVAGGLAATIAWIARHRLGISLGVAYLAGGIFGLSVPLAPYSTQIYPEIVAALALTAGVGALLGPMQRPGVIVVTVAVVMLPWLAVKYVPVAAALAVVALVRTTSRRRLWLGGFLVVAAGIYVVAHLGIYRGFTAYATGDHFVGGEFTAVGTGVNLWGRSTRLVGLLIDSGFGIGVWQPAFLLLPTALGWAISSKQSQLQIPLFIAGVGWLVAGFVALTMHGWWFPGRQIVVVTPLLVLLLARWADETRRRLTIFQSLGSMGVAAFAFLVFEGWRGDLTWVVDFDSTTNPIYRSLSTVTPDYMSPTGSTWVSHAVWLGVLAGTAWWGWRAGRLEPSDEIDVNTQPIRKEKVLK